MFPEWEKMAQAVGMIILALGGVIATVREHNKSDGSPPKSRDPSPSEVREALNELRRIMDRHKEIGDNATDRIEDKLETIMRAMDRIESSQRLERVVNDWRAESINEQRRNRIGRYDDDER